MFYFWSEDAEWLALRQEILYHDQMIKYENGTFCFPANFSYELKLFINFSNAYIPVHFHSYYVESDADFHHGKSLGFGIYLASFFYTSVFRQLWDPVA